jgi:hypothetical protein
LGCIKKLAEGENVELIALLHGLFNLNKESWKEVALISSGADKSKAAFLESIIDLINFKAVDRARRQKNSKIENFLNIPNVIISNGNDKSKSHIDLIVGIVQNLLPVMYPNHVISDSKKNELDFVIILNSKFLGFTPKQKDDSI